MKDKFKKSRKKNIRVASKKKYSLKMSLTKSILPLAIIISLLVILHNFYFSERGYLNQQKRIQEYIKLNKKLRKLQEKYYYNIKYLDDLLENKLALQKEARKLSLKKPGEEIINLYHEDLIDNAIKSLPEKDNKNYHTINTSLTIFDNKWSFILVISILISSIVIFLVFAIYSNRKTTFR